MRILLLPIYLILLAISFYFLLTGELVYSGISFFIFLIAFLFGSCCIILKEYERAIIFRFGRFHKVGGPGLVFLLPKIDKIYKIVDIRTKCLGIKVKDAFTSDGAKIDIQGLLYYKVVNPRKAILNVENFREQIERMIESDIRDLVATMTLKEVFANVELINDLIMRRISPLLSNWGIDIVSVQIRRVLPAPEIAKMLVRRRAMEEEYAIRKMLADARRIAIKALGEGARFLDDKALLYLYMLALQELSRKVSDVDIIGGLGIPKGLNKTLANLGYSLPTAVALIKNIMENEAKKKSK